jgi:hypothetical protein
MHPRAVQLLACIVRFRAAALDTPGSPTEGVHAMSEAVVKQLAKYGWPGVLVAVVFVLMLAGIGKGCSFEFQVGQPTAGTPRSE